MATMNVPPFARKSFQSSTAGLQQFQFCQLTNAGLLEVPAVSGVFAVVLDDAPSLTVSTVGTGGVETGGYAVSSTYYGCVLPFGGIMKVLCGATMNAGVAVQTNVSGQAVAALSGAVVLGWTTRAVSSGDTAEIFLSAGGYHN